MGPNTDPCGMPLMTSDQEEYYELFMTLPIRKAVIQFSNRPYAFSLTNSLL